MGKLLSLILVLLIVPGTLAVSVEDLKKEAGTPPDSFFYKIDRLVERVQLLLARGEEGKAEARLGFARERLGEFKVMLDKGRTEQAEIAMQEYLLNVKYARDFSFKSSEDFTAMFTEESALNVDFLDALNEDTTLLGFQEEIKEALRASKVITTNVDVDSPLLNEETKQEETTDESPSLLSDALKAHLEGAQEEVQETPEPEPEPEAQEEEPQEEVQETPEPEPEPEAQEEEESDTLGYVNPTPKPGYH